jgi:drug/metabolite transporter (DMT)-like permease
MVFAVCRRPSALLTLSHPALVGCGLQLITFERHHKMDPTAKHQLTGVALMVAGTLLISPDALLVILVSRTELPGVKLFYKYLMSASMQWLFCTLLLGGPRKTWKHMRQGGRWAILGAFLQTFQQICLNFAFMNTSSANALVIFSLHAVWAAIGGWLFMADKLPPRTIVMVAVGMASAIAIFIWGKDSVGTSSVFGDVCACAGGLGFASVLLVYRYASKHMPPGTSMLASTCTGSTISACIGLALTKGNVALTGGTSSILLLALNGGVVVGLAMLLYTIGPKYITAAEVTLMCLLEPCIGPLWVFLALGEVPALASVIAGVILPRMRLSHYV